MKRATLSKYQDGSWIVGTIEEEEEEKEEKEEMNSCFNPTSNLDTKKLDILAKIFSWKSIGLILYGAALGMSIAVNIFQYFYIESIK